MAKHYAFAKFEITIADIPLIETLSTDHQKILKASMTMASKDLPAFLNWPVGTTKSRLNRARHLLVNLRAK